MGALASARFHYDRKDEKTAKAQLQWVIERSKFDDLRDIARLRLAAILLDEKILRRGAQAARGEARRSVHRAIRCAQGRHPGRQGADRGSERPRTASLSKGGQGE
jgi:predicted negative regulator of RcsB-dependent stress response